MIGDFWYYRAIWVNNLQDQRRKLRVYGLRSFLPHRHIPHRIPAGDGAYCRRCGNRNDTVQKRWSRM